MRPNGEKHEEVKDLKNMGSNFFLADGEKKTDVSYRLSEEARMMGGLDYMWRTRSHSPNFGSER